MFYSFYTVFKVGAIYYVYVDGGFQLLKDAGGNTAQSCIESSGL